MKLAILANRESVLQDARKAFPEDELVVQQVVPDMSDTLEVARSFHTALQQATELGDEVRLILACPVVVGYLLGALTHHTTRKLHLAVLDLQTKTYRTLDVSGHLEYH